MDTADDVIRIQESAEILQKTLKTKLPDGLQDMVAVQERLETYNVHGNRFSDRVFKFLKDQFEQQVRFLDNKYSPNYIYMFFFFKKKRLKYTKR